MKIRTLIDQELLHETIYVRITWFEHMIVKENLVAKQGDREANVTDVTRRVTVIQPALPAYRLDFFDRVADQLGAGFSVYATPGDLGVLTEAVTPRTWSRHLGRMQPLVPGAAWQRGALAIPIARGDVLVISGAPRCLSNVVLLLRARWRGARTVWWSHLWSATSRRHRYLVRLLLMRLADALLFYTDEEVETYSKGQGQHNLRPVAALNNGINIDPILPLRSAYDPVTRGLRILFIGRLTPKAELDILLRALARSELSAATLDVIGDGSEGARLQTLARELDLESRVIWHGGTTDETRISEIANQCAVFCYPGGVGLSLIHAMAYGLPAVVHNHRPTHMPEIAAFQPGITGASFAKGNEAALSGQLGTLLGNPVALTSMSAKARERVELLYNTRMMAERFCTLVEKLK